MRDPGTSSRQQGGVPDGLLVGLLGFLLAVTLLAWSAAGLSGLFAHGSWPEGVAFTRTPLALRHLVADPRDLATAWPDANPDSLSGYGLFWGIFIGQLMVLIVLTVFVVGVLARWRALRASRREAARYGPPATGRGHGTAAAPAAEPTGAAGPTGSPVGAPVEAADGAWAARAATGAGAATTPGTPGGAAPGVPLTTPAGPPDGPAPTGTPGGSGGVPDPRTPDAAAPSPQDTRAAAQAPGVRPSNAPTELSAPVAVTAASGGTPATAPAGTSSGVAPVPSAGSATAAGLGGVHFTGPDRETRHDLAVQAVLDADGPVLVTTSDPGLWADTKDARNKLGPVHLYDPSHLLDTPSRLRWSPAAGCESREVAAARAAALLAPVRPVHALDSVMAEAAETLLRCWLHAAAVDGRPFRQVHRWASGSAAHEPVRILRTHPEAAAGSAGELESALTAHPERREIAQELTARALSALSSIHIRDACNPTRADSLALESFITEGGSLYVLGEAIEDPRSHPGAMPLLTALVSNVVELGRRMAERSSAGRLDPPLTLVLDDVAAVAPFPQLPDLLNSGTAQGLPTLALLRSEEQARARWPRQSLVR